MTEILIIALLTTISIPVIFTVTIAAWFFINKRRANKALRHLNEVMGKRHVK